MRIINRKNKFMYIYESENWANFLWNKDFINDKLLIINKKAGFLSWERAIDKANENLSNVLKTVK